MEFGEELPEQSNALRSARPWQVLADPPTLAFMLREGEPDISMQWLEYFAAEAHEDRVKEACHALCVTPNKSWSMLTVSVDDARRHLSESDSLGSARVVYTPDEDKSHCSVLGIAELEVALQQLAALALARAIWGKAEWRVLQDRGLAPL